MATAKNKAPTRALATARTISIGSPINSNKGEITKMNGIAEIDFVDGSSAMSEVRMIKTKDELECIKLSVSLAELAFESTRDVIRPTIKEC